MKRYDPIEFYSQGGSGLGQMEECKDGDFVKHEEIDDLHHDIFVLVLRLMGEDKKTHSPDTLAVLDRWEPTVCDKIEKTKPFHK